MYNVIKSVVTSGNFKLADIQHKIKKLYALGDLTEAQMDELLLAASGGVNTDAERPDVLDMLKKLSERVDTLEEKLNGTAEETGHPAWAAWDGISDQYQPGAIVSHNGKLWQSVYEGQNVWEPGAAGVDERFWVEHVPAE